MKATLSLLILTLSLSAFSQSEVKYCNYLFKSCATIDPATCAIAELPTENALLDCQNIVLEQIPFFKAEGEKIGTKYAALSEKISAIVRNESEGQFKKMYTDASSKLLETATQYQNLNAPFGI